MAQALLIAILVSLQLPQAIAGSVAFCYCASGIVVAQEAEVCRHCDGDCHSQAAPEHEAPGDEATPGCESRPHEPCSDCLHLSLFAGDTVRSANDLPAAADLSADFALPPLRAPLLATRAIIAADRVDFWDLQAGEAIALRC